MAKPRSQPVSWRTILLACLMLVILVAIAYREAPRNGFHLDDGPHILDNAAVHIDTLDLKALKGAASEALLENRKLAYVTLAFDWWRGSGNPRAFQITNMFIHAATALATLLLLSLVLTTGNHSLSRWRFSAAFGGAALWATHPVQVQAVTYIIQRMASLAALFVVLAVSTYILARRTSRPRSTAAYGLLCGLSILAAAYSKENAWIVPLLILGAELGIVRTTRSVFRTQAGRAVVVGALLAGTVLFVVSCFGLGPVFDRFEPSFETRDFTLQERVLTQPRVVLFHVSQLLWPHPGRFSLVHDFEKSISFTEPWTTGPAIFLIAGWIMTGILLLRRVKARPLGFLMLWVPATLLIESTFVSLELVFEHRMYLPSVGLFGMVAWALSSTSLSRTRARVVTATIALVAIGCLCVLTAQVVPRWQNERTLMEQAVRVAPGSDRAWVGLGHALLRDGEQDAALTALEYSLKLDPDNIEAPEFIGVILMDQGRLDEAETMLVRALAGGRNDPSLANHLGELRLQQGSFHEAERWFRTAIEIKSWNAVYHWNLALALERQSRCVEARESWNRCLELNSELGPVIHNHLAEVYETLGGACFDETK